MKQTKPIIHGRDHLPAGADPMTPNLPSGTVERAILATLPGAYYKVPETTGPWLDSSGAGRDATYVDSSAVSGGSSPTRGVPALINEDDGTRCVLVNGPDPAAALETSEVGVVADAFFDMAGYQPFTVSALIRPAVLPAGTFSMGVLGNAAAAVAGSITGWGLFVLSAVFDPDSGSVTGKPAFIRSVVAPTGSGMAYSTVPLAAGEWVRLTGVYDGTTVGLYIDANATAGFDNDYGDPNPSLPSTSTFGFGAARKGEGAGGTYAPFQGEIDSIIVWDRALSPTEISSIVNADISGRGTEGLVLGITDDGTFGWVQPKVDVTVNGDPPPAATGPPAALPTDPNDVFPGDNDWIVDQPFLWGGSSFEVPPNKWTTIPFSSQLMERWSNVTGVGTKMLELDWDDPAAGGWINPDEPHVITVPHDLPYYPAPGSSQLNWMQVCLRLEGPMVESGTFRALRIFETTHQKTIVEQHIQRSYACLAHGAVDARREAGKPGTGEGGTGDPELFASGDTGGFDNGNHDTIYLVPNSGEAFYEPGRYWLPGHTQDPPNPTLKEGMRLVAQVWHDASVPLTFHLDPPPGPVPTYGPYRPHFVIWYAMDRAWGPPWSDWPLYT